jgi:hypothetical protein
MKVRIWTGAVSRTFKESYCNLVSGADSILPSLAGWEKTKQSQLRKGSSHHEATHYCSGIAVGHSSVRQRVGQDALVSASVEFSRGWSG